MDFWRRFRTSLVRTADPSAATRQSIDNASWNPRAEIDSRVIGFHTRWVSEIRRPRKSFSVLRQSRLWIGALALFALVFGVIGADPAELSRDKWIAAFLSKLPRYVEWKDESFENATSPFVMVILGEDPTGGLLGQLMAKTEFSGRAVDVVVSNEVGDVPARFQMLFIPTSQEGAYQKFLESYREANPGRRGLPNVLTVLETESKRDSGAVISFFSVDNNHTVEVFLNQARESDLKISSKLLKICNVHRD